MHVILIAPHFPANQRRFLRGLKNVGAYVTGIIDWSWDNIDSEVRSLLDGYEVVNSVTNEDAVFEAVRRVQKRGPWVHRLESTVEAHQYVAAKVRERAGIPGMSYETVDLCRDKFKMKAFLRAHNVNCARQAAVSNAAETREAAREIGFPLILKPRDGAGAQGTYKVGSVEDLERAIAEIGLDRGGRHYSMEEFLSGHEGFYDTVTIGGKVVYEFVSHYYPNVLEAMRTRWINPQIVTTNRIDSSSYNELRVFGRNVVRTMGIESSATHMEWFYGANGLKFAEIGARPPGCNFWDLYCAANDLDLYTEWARGICWGDVHATPSRRFSAGLVAIRPNQDGTIVGYSGVEEIEKRYGQHILKMVLPGVGGRTQPVEAGYIANAYVTVRHPDYDGTRAILDDIGRTIKMWAK